MAALSKRRYMRGVYEALPAGLDIHFQPRRFEGMMPVGQPEDRAMQGCNLSAALEAGAGGAWKHALPLFWR